MENPFKKILQPQETAQDPTANSGGFSISKITTDINTPKKPTNPRAIKAKTSIDSMKVYNQAFSEELAKTTGNIFKDILQGTARTVATVGVEGINLPTNIGNTLTRAGTRVSPKLFGGPIQELPIAEETPTNTSPITNSLFGGKPIRTVKSAGGNAITQVNEMAGREIIKPTTKNKYLAGFAGVALDLSGMGGGKASVKTFMNGEVPEKFFKYVAKETNADTITRKLIDAGLDDQNAKILGEKFSIVDTVDDAKRVLADHGKASATENPFSNILKSQETKATPEVVPNVPVEHAPLTKAEEDKNLTQDPILNTKRDVIVRDVAGNKVTLPEGEAYTPHIQKDGKIILQDGIKVTVNKSTYEAVKQNSVVEGGAKPFAPELRQTQEIVKGQKDIAQSLNLGESGAYDSLPDKVKKIIEKYSGDEGSYESNNKMIAELEKEGWTADYGLSGEIETLYKKSEGTPTKYANYQLPDGNNYKEILIQSPRTAPYTNENVIPVKEGSIVSDPARFWYFKTPDNVFQILKSEYPTEESAKQYIIDKKVSTTDQINTFKSGHWEEPNVLTHLRMNERTYKGKKVSFIEEVQSDWAREGRKKGFISNIEKPILPEGYRVVSNGDTFQVVDKNGQRVPDKLHGSDYAYGGNEDIAIAKATGNDSYIKSKGGVPNNPLLKNWTELTVKRALKEAVDSGAEYLAWINGEQTSNRYNLATHIDNVKWGKTSPSEPVQGKDIRLIPKDNYSSNRIAITIDDNGVIVAGNKPDWKGKKLNEVVGKGLADKIMEKQDGTLSGEGLKFGGEWASNLYDKQVPNIIKELTGQKPEVIDMKLPIGKEQTRFYHIQNGVSGSEIAPTQLEVGKEVADSNGQYYKITDVLGDGKFKAVSKREINLTGLETAKLRHEETFDISQKMSSGQQAIKITPEIKALVRGEAPKLKQPSGVIPESSIPKKKENLIEGQSSSIGTTRSQKRSAEKSSAYSSSQITFPKVSESDNALVNARIDATMKRIQEEASGKLPESLIGKKPAVAKEIPEIKKEVSPTPEKTISEADRLIAEGKIRVVSRNGRDTYQIKKAGEWTSVRDEDSAVRQLTRVVTKKPTEKPVLSQELEQKAFELEMKKEAIDSIPAKALEKFYDPKLGGIPEAGKSAFQRGTLRKASKWRSHGDEIAMDLGYADSEQAREAFDQYKFRKDELKKEIRDFNIQKAEELKKTKALGKMMKEEKKKEKEIIVNKEIQTRKAERQKAFDEAQKKSEEIKAEKLRKQENIRKAFTADKTKQTGFFSKLKDSLVPIRTLDTETQQAYKNWTRGRNLAIEAGNREFGTIGVPEKEGMQTIFDYQAGKQNPYTDKIKKTFDSLFKEANTKYGIETNYRQNYLPQVWKETPEEMTKKILKYLSERGLSKDEAMMYMEGKPLPSEKVTRLGLKPFFSKDRIFPTYKVGMEYGLTPRYKNPDQLVSYYKQQLEKAVADRTFLNTLIEKGKVLPVEDAPNTWKPVALPFSQKGYYASPELAKFLNNIFENKDLGFLDSMFSGTAKISKKAQELALSAGLPKSNVNFFSIGQTIKEMTRGNFKAGSIFIRANFNDASIKYFKENENYIKKMAEQGIDLSGRIGTYDNVYKNLSETWKNLKKNPFSKKTFAKENRQGMAGLLGESFDKAFNEKTFGSFMPQLYTQVFKDVYQKAVLKGLNEAEAGKLAGDITKKTFGMIENVGRSKETQDKLSATFFAPKFRESIINTLFNTGKAGADFVKNLGGARGKMDETLINNRRLLAGMILTYGAYNLLNKELNGNYMWDNPKNRQFALQIPTKNGTYVYVEFMPSFLAFGRNIATGAINLATGDVKGATQKFGSVFSMPVKITSEIIGNSDYFGRPIYKDTDTGATKALKVAKYTGLAVSHPYIKEVVNQVEDKKPLYQSIVSALELPIKFGSKDAVSKQEFYDALDKKKVQNARDIERIKPIYEKVAKLIDEGKEEEATTIVTELAQNPDDYAVYKKILISDKRNQTIQNEATMYSTVQEVQRLVNEGRDDEATAIVEEIAQDPEMYKAYLLVLKRLPQ